MHRPNYLALCLAVVTASSALIAQETSQSKFQRDRQAILAMAGEFEVLFQFKETVPLKAGYVLKKPYEAHATEFVHVVEDAGNRITLQHILVTEPRGRVVKHWAQEWRFEPGVIHEFQGFNTWQPRKLTDAQRTGAWSQTVYQVDDSPRYTGIGKWEHEAGVSTWESNDVWRPLPRREHTKRDDYHVLVTRHRHTITPHGWTHEQDSAKRVLGEDVDVPVLVRERGVNLYDRVDDVDFSAGREYWARTHEFWADVRAAWRDLLAKGQPVKLRDKVDGKRMYRVMFERAKAISKDDAYDTKAGRQWIDQTLNSFLID